MEENFKRKAVDINVESVKLYLTLSTILIAGLLTFYSRLQQPDWVFLFGSSLILFLLCAISSIMIVNHFIFQANNDKYDVRSKRSISLNWIAIILFFLGLVSGGFFITVNSNPKKADQQSKESGIVIKNNEIRIFSDIKTKVIIENDTIKHVQKVLINNEN